MDFTLDEAAFAAWIKQKWAEEVDPDEGPDAATVTFEQLNQGGDHGQDLDGYLQALEEAGALRKPAAFGLLCWALDDDDSCGYLLCVSHGGVQVGLYYTELDCHRPVLEELSDVIKQANWLIPLAEAAARAAQEESE